MPLNWGRSKTKNKSSDTQRAALQTLPSTPQSPTTDSTTPLVHDLYEQSTQTWQYIVADPTTLHCMVIDPVREHGSSNQQVCTKAADAILAFVRMKHYLVDLVLETYSSPRDNRSAAWYLRMQLLESQGYAPRVCSAAEVSGMSRLFARKYGAGLRTNLEDDFRDGESVDVGHMRVKVLHLPGLCTPQGRVYIVDDNVFGAHSIAHLKQKMDELNFTEEYPLATMSEDECHLLWVSLQKILGMSRETRIYFDRGDGLFLGGRPKGKSILKEGPQRCFKTIAECRAINDDIQWTAREFMSRWEEARRADPRFVNEQQDQQ